MQTARDNSRTMVFNVLRVTLEKRRRRPLKLQYVRRTKGCAERQAVVDERVHSDKFEGHRHFYKMMSKHARYHR